MTPWERLFYVSVPDLVEHLRFPSEEAARAWVRRQGIQVRRRGRNVLLKRADVDRALAPVERGDADLVLVHRSSVSR